MSFIHSTAPDGFVKFFVYKKEMMSTDGKETNLSDSKESTMIDVVSEIISISTSKPKSGGGTFTIMLGSNTNWKSLISLGSWCSIHMSDRKLNTGAQADQNCGMKMFGRVKSIRRREQVNPANGAKIVRYVISGEDFHSVLMSKIYINPMLTSTKNGNSGGTKASPDTMRELILFNGQTSLTLATPGVIVNKLIDAIIGNSIHLKDGKTGEQVEQIAGQSVKVGQPIHVPSSVFKYLLKSNGNDFAELLTRFVQGDLFGKLSSVNISIGDMVELWGMIETYSNRMLNDVYTDLMPFKLDDGSVHLVPGFILRAIPFSSDAYMKSSLKESSCIAYTSAKPSKFNSKNSKAKNKSKAEADVLKSASARNSSFFISKYIHEDEIIAFDSGRSDHSVFNFWFVNTSFFNFNTSTSMALAEISDRDIVTFGNVASQARFGFRPYISTTIYTEALDDGKSPSVFKGLNSSARILRDMWENAHLYESGSVTIIGSHLHIPVGTNIVFAERGWMVHVESVSHTFSVEGSSGIKSFSTSIAFSRLSNLKGLPIDTQEKGNKSGTLGEWDRSANKGGS